jgi:hypothetical protein
MVFVISEDDFVSGELMGAENGKLLQRDHLYYERCDHTTSLRKKKTIGIFENMSHDCR